MTEYRRLVPSAKVVEGRITLAFLGTRRVAVTRVAGVAHVFNNLCPHAGSPLSAGTMRDGVVTCARHGWAFDVATGACRTQPEYSLRRYAAREREGWIEAVAPDETW